MRYSRRATPSVDNPNNQKTKEQRNKGNAEAEIKKAHCLSVAQTWGSLDTETNRSDPAV